MSECNLDELLNCALVDGNSIYGLATAMTVVPDGDRRVIKILEWAGGAGGIPGVGQYVGANGFTYDISQAVDLLNPPGEVDVTGSLAFTQLGAMRYGGDNGTPVEGNIIEGLMRLITIHATNTTFTISERNRYV